MTKRFATLTLSVVAAGILSQSAFASEIILPATEDKVVVLEAIELENKAEKETTENKTNSENEKAAYRKKRLEKKKEKIKEAKQKRQKRIATRDKKIADAAAKREEKSKQKATSKKSSDISAEETSEVNE